MTDELARLQRLVRMIPPAQLVCLEAADEIIESGLLGTGWVLEQVGLHDAWYDQRTVQWVRPRADGWNAALNLLPPIKELMFECRINIVDDRHHGRTAVLQRPRLCGDTATEAVTGALAELDRYFERYPDVV